jgi:hypothetical protein
MIDSEGTSENWSESSLMIQAEDREIGGIPSAGKTLTKTVQFSGLTDRLLNAKYFPRLVGIPKNHERQTRYPERRNNPQVC